MKLETFFNKIVKQLSFCENLQEVIEKYSETTLNKETSDFLDMLINYFNSKSFYMVDIPYKDIAEKFKIDNIDETRKFVLKQLTIINDISCFLDYNKRNYFRFRIIAYFSLIDDENICIDFSEIVYKYLKTKKSSKEL